MLLDTGEGQPAYLPLLQEALSALGPAARVLSIVLSHHHGDHVKGLAGVLSLLWKRGGPVPRVYKWPGTEAQDAPLRATLLEHATAVAASAPLLESLEHGQQLLPAGSLVQLEVMHTPGHTQDSVALLCRHLATAPSLFTADTVLGHSTAVFEDLSAYMKSLEMLIARLELLQETGPINLYCGHGETVEDGVGKLQEYVRHRSEREQQVIQALEHQHPGMATAEQLVSLVPGSKQSSSLI